jgi:REP element-mobilizing transposase RayT
MELPKRKHQRIPNYDYSQNNAYFITMCTQNKKHILGEVKNCKMILNDFGIKVVSHIEKIELLYDDIKIDNYVVMPNHIHFIFTVSHSDSGTTQGSFPTISEIIQHLKTITTKDYIDGVKTGIYPAFDKKIWQKSFHDHIIRNEKGYLKIWVYIDNNPISWEKDCFF